jgi:ribonuclease Z
MIDFYNIPTSQINNIKAGLDWTSPEGEVIKNELLTSDPDPVRSYAYCSDTRYFPELAEKIKDVTLLYHESTYTEDFKEKAVKYLHSTAREAAMTAKNANATQLMLGHYSQRYNTDEPLLQEVKQVFKNTILANEGLIVEVRLR